MLVFGIISGLFEVNYLKIVVILKFIRVKEFDEFYLRRFAVNRALKMVYVLLQQFVIIFVLSHIIGVMYYWIDYAMLSS